MRITSIACDSCGVHETKTPVKPWSARRGSTHYKGELCDNCFDKMMKAYKPTTRGAGKHEIVETKIKDIQKKA